VQQLLFAQCCTHFVSMSCLRTWSLMLRILCFAMCSVHGRVSDFIETTRSSVTQHLLLAPLRYSDVLACDCAVVSANIPSFRLLLHGMCSVLGAISSQ
jgi:hypothetical protein